MFLGGVHVFSTAFPADEVSLQGGFDRGKWRIMGGGFVDFSGEKSFRKGKMTLTVTWTGSFLTACCVSY